MLARSLQTNGKLNVCSEYISLRCEIWQKGVCRGFDLGLHCTSSKFQHCPSLSPLLAGGSFVVESLYSVMLTVTFIGFISSWNITREIY